MLLSCFQTCHFQSSLLALLPSLPPFPLFPSFPISFKFFHNCQQNIWWHITHVEPLYRKTQLKCLRLCPFGLGAIKETSGTYACHSWGRCTQRSTHRSRRHVFHCCTLHAHRGKLQTESGDFSWPNLDFFQRFCKAAVFNSVYWDSAWQSGETMGLKP